MNLIVEVGRTVPQIVQPEPELPESYVPDPDYAGWDDADVAAEFVKVEREHRRRDVMARSLLAADEAARAWHAASGRVEGDEWVEPDSATSTYPMAWVVTFDEKLWRSERHSNMRRPGDGDAWVEVDPEPVEAPDEDEPAEDPL